MDILTEVVIIPCKRLICRKKYIHVSVMFDVMCTEDQFCYKGIV